MSALILPNPRVVACVLVTMFSVGGPARGGTIVFDKAVSRAVTVVNRGAVPPVFDEAISRPASVVNRGAVPPVFDEAISRPASVVNRGPVPLVFNQAVSRAASVCNLAGWGDIDGSGVIDLTDLDILVDVLVGNDTDPTHIEGADINCDDTTDGLDIQPFVEAVLAPL